MLWHNWSEASSISEMVVFKRYYCDNQVAGADGQGRDIKFLSMQEHWNSTIRRNSNNDSISGRLSFLPELNAQNKKSIHSDGFCNVENGAENGNIGGYSIKLFLTQRLHI